MCSHIDYKKLITVTEKVVAIICKCLKLHKVFKISC